MFDLLLALKNDIFIFILSEWLESYVEVSALDIAVMNAVLRAKYILCTKQLTYAHNEKLLCTMKLLNNIKFKNFCHSRYSNPISVCEIDFINGGTFSFYPVSRLISSFESLLENYEINSVRRVSFQKLNKDTEETLKILGNNFPNMKHLTLCTNSVNADLSLLPPYSNIPHSNNSLQLTSFSMQPCDEKTLRYLQILENSPSKRSLKSISLRFGGSIHNDAAHVKIYIANMFPQLTSITFQDNTHFAWGSAQQRSELSEQTIAAHCPPSEGYPRLRQLTIDFFPLSTSIVADVLMPIYEKKSKELIPLFQAAHQVEELYLKNLSLADADRDLFFIPFEVLNRAAYIRNMLLSSSGPLFSPSFEQLIPSMWTQVRILHLRSVVFMEPRIFASIFSTCGHSLQSFLLSAHQLHDDKRKTVVLDADTCDSIAKDCTVLHTLSLESVYVEDVEKFCTGKFPLQHCTLRNCILTPADGYRMIGEQFALKTFQIEASRRSDNDVRVNFPEIAVGLIAKTGDIQRKKAMEDTLESLEVSLHPSKSIVVVIRGESTGSKNRPKQLKATWKSLSIQEFPYMHLRSLLLTYVYLDTITLQTIFTKCANLAIVKIVSAKRYEIDLNTITPLQLQHMQSFAVSGDEVLLSTETLVRWIKTCKLLHTVQCTSNKELPSMQVCGGLKRQYKYRIRDIMMSTIRVNSALNSDEEEDPAGYHPDMF